MKFSTFKFFDTVLRSVIPEFDFGKIFSRLAELLEVLKPLIAPALLFPVAPLLGWGPATHIFLNKRALDRIEPDEVTDDRVKKILADEKLREIFINAGNSVDLIKANNLRNRERCFEYAHNTVPNYFTGDPLMGRFLIEEIEKSGGDPIKQAWALGWLAHQVSDGFAHKIPHAGCEGWVNSRRVLAGYYRPETETESVSTASARIELYMADHWLVEMLTDCLCYEKERDFIDSFKLDLTVPTDGEVLIASRRILDGYEKQLGPGYVYFQPLSDEKLKSITDYYHLLILCSLDVYRAILRAYPGGKFESYITESPRMGRLDELLGNSIDAIVYMLNNPSNPWLPRTWLLNGENKFNQSVYEYERIWRPGRYKFGRKTGLLGSLYYNRNTDYLIKFARGFCEVHDIWPFIRFGVSTFYFRGRGHWYVSSAFVRALVGRHPENVETTSRYAAEHCGLKRYEEIVPD
ncbi:MAG: zinc dependent phospholipase C family protein [bacterium]